jgi:hypothetical protein
VFKVGGRDRVLLRTKELRDAADICKLLPRWDGPFMVTACPSPNAYRLALPPQMQCSPTVNVDRLKPFHKRVDAPGPSGSGTGRVVMLGQSSGFDCLHSNNPGTGPGPVTGARRTITHPLAAEAPRPSDLTQDWELNVSVSDDACGSLNFEHCLPGAGSIQLRLKVWRKHDIFKLGVAVTGTRVLVPTSEHGQASSMRSEARASPGAGSARLVVDSGLRSRAQCSGGIMARRGPSAGGQEVRLGVKHLSH